MSAIISAVSGISGVLFGNSFVAVKEWLVHRGERRKATEYLAIIVVSHLDRFANGCSHVAFDDGTAYGRPAGPDGEEFTPTTTPPVFQPLDIDVEWKVLPVDLMYAILRLPDQHEQLQSWLAGIAEFDDDYPDHTDYFRKRRREYASLGLQASDLARQLRKHVGMPLEDDPAPNGWNRDQELRELIRQIDAAQAEHNRRLAEVTAKTPAVSTPE
ncbi:hypothetical protein [Caballeronia glebae]|uniref:hypothetical protein n=1 Tax=Caballeronia glebae TaxID=1777143 RepID=UPI001F28C635|nr:hypothetical protein [Caballeronia glebae]